VIGVAGYALFVPPSPDALLSLLPVSSVAFALGVCVSGPQRAENAGRVALLIADLRRRGVYNDLLASLDPELARRLALLEALDRGQAWNRGARTPH
jgi:hypothetical protein